MLALSELTNCTFFQTRLKATNRIEATYFLLHYYEVRGSGKNVLSLQGTGQIRRKLPSSCQIDRSLGQYQKPLQYVPKLDKFDVWVTSTIFGHISQLHACCVRDTS